MTFTLTIGTWIWPTLITIIMLAVQHIHAWYNDKKDTSWMFRMAGGITWLLWSPVVVAVSLGSWLAWALMK